MIGETPWLFPELGLRDIDIVDTKHGRPAWRMTQGLVMKDQIRGE